MAVKLRIKNRNRCTVDWLRFLVTLAVLTGCAEGSSSDGLNRTKNALPTLYSTKAVHQLTSVEAQRGYPVDLHAIVTYYDLFIDHASINRGRIFINDATGGLYVSMPPETTLPLREGTRVEVKGVTAAGNFAPIVTKPTVRILGQSSMKWAAVPLQIPLVMTGAYDCKWVIAEGVVQMALLSEHNVELKLASAGGVIGATTVREPGYDYTQLINATVLLHANAGVQYNRSHQITGAHLFFQSLKDLKVERAAPKDPFASPQRSIKQLFQYNPNGRSFEGVHVHGRVTLSWPDRYLCVQDETAGLCFERSQGDTAAEPGDLVDVQGFPRVEDSIPGLYDVRLRVLGKATPVAPVPLTASRVLNGEHSGELIELEGKLISAHRGDRDYTLIVDAGGVIFPAIFSGLPDAESRFPNKPGSVLQLAGISLPRAETRGVDVQAQGQQFTSFRLLLRGPADVRVLATPSWWNGQHTLTVLMGVGATTLAILCWAAALRRQVQEQTRTIRRSEEQYRHLAQHDVLTGLANRMLLHERLDAAIHTASRAKTRVALLMMDLDKFKQVNDTLGHHAGDLLLCATADRLRNEVGEKGVVARMGGDEFVVLLTEVQDSQAVLALGNAIVAALSVPVEMDGRQIPVATSVGVCLSYPGCGSNGATLLQNVDAAMYRAKQLGGHRVEEFKPEVVQTTVTTSYPLQSRPRLA